MASTSMCFALLLTLSMLRVQGGHFSQFVAPELVYTEGELSVMGTVFNDGTHSTSYFLFPSSEQMLELFFDQDLPEYYTSGWTLSVGSSLQATTSEGVLPTMWVQDFSVVSRPALQPSASLPTQQPSSRGGVDGGNRKLRQISGDGWTGHHGDVATAASATSSRSLGVMAQQAQVVKEMTILIMVLQLCDQPATVSDKVMEEFAFADLDNYYDACSYGKAKVNASNSRVVSVPLGCSGTSMYGGVPWDAQSCSSKNLYGWMFTAEEYVSGVLGVDLSLYKHHVMVLPRNSTAWGGSSCGWSGQGILGMMRGQAWSYAWVNGDVWNQAQVYMHELGHNNNLNHAAVITAGGVECSHCDWSSAMGYCCVQRCMSAPHNWQLGWASPIATVDGSSLLPGETLYFSLPVQYSSDANMVVVTTDWADINATHNYFVSYRQQSLPYDTGMPGFFGGILVHQYDGQSQSDAVDTLRVTMLVGNGVWRDTQGSQLVIRQVSSSDAASAITLCRPSHAAEDTVELCSDGLDNDCDGMVDLADASCLMLVPLQPTADTTSEPPSPPQPSPTATPASLSPSSPSPSPDPSPTPASPGQPSAPLFPATQSQGLPPAYPPPAPVTASPPSMPSSPVLPPAPPPPTSASTPSPSAQSTPTPTTDPLLPTGTQTPRPSPPGAKAQTPRKAVRAKPPSHHAQRSPSPPAGKKAGCKKEGTHNKPHRLNRL